MKINKPPAWTGIMIGKMHNECVTRQELAAQLGKTKSQITMVLNGQRKPSDAKEKFSEALDCILKSRTNEA